MSDPRALLKECKLVINQLSLGTIPMKDLVDLSNRLDKFLEGTGSPANPYAACCNSFNIEQCDCVNKDHTTMLVG